MPFVAEALYRSLGSPDSVHVSDWPEARPEWIDEPLARGMDTVRAVVRLARSVRERLRLKHRHPLAALHVGGVDAAVLSGHEDLLEQEVNVKRVVVLEDPDRYVRRSVRLNAAELGRRLKQRLPPIQAAVAAGEFVIDPDGTLRAGGVALDARDYTYRLELVDQAAPAAAEGGLVVVLNVARDDDLRLEGEARDLNRAIQDLRKRAGLRYSDRVVLSISGSGLEPFLAAFGPWLMEQALAVDLVTTPLRDPLASAAARLDSGSVQVAIARAVQPAPAGPGADQDEMDRA
jgi:isoleucyl-tRNA synthetase